MKSVRSPATAGPEGGSRPDGPVTPSWQSPGLLIAANVIPVAGVLFFNWDLFLILALFWVENVVIGGFGILRVVLSGEDRPRRRLIEPLFFVAHYGGFMFAHALLLLSVFGDTARVDGGVHDFPDFIDYLARPGVAIAVAALLVAHAGSFVSELNGGVLRRQRSRDAMTLPYRRVLITQAGLLIGALLVERLGQPVLGLVALLAIKTALDIGQQRREQRAGYRHGD